MIRIVPHKPILTSLPCVVLSLVVLIQTGTAGLAASGAEATPFAQEPDGTLIRCLEPLAAATPDSPGVAIDVQQRWLPELKALCLETRLTNSGDAPRMIRRPPLLDWTFRLQDTSDAGYQRLTYREDVWYGSTYWTGPDWTRVGKDWHHPGENTTAVRRFTCPSDGRVIITGRVYKAHVAASDGVRLAIRHGAKTVWQAEIGGEDATGVEPNLELNVRAGDALRFVVHKRGQIFCDTTHWDPLVAYADGRRFLASESFDAKKQGQGGWSYEMEADAQTGRGLPRLYTLSTAGVVREHALAPGQPVALDGGTTLPWLILADDQDQSGVALAWNADATWQLSVALAPNARLRLQLWQGDPKSEAQLTPRQMLSLPPVIAAPYRGSWIGGVSVLARAFRSDAPGVDLSLCKRAVDAALQSAGGSAGRLPDLDLHVLLQAEWRREDKLEGGAKAKLDAIVRHHELTGKLLADLRNGRPADFLAAEAAELERLRPAFAAAARTDRSAEELHQLYFRVRSLKRRVVLANPLLDFQPLLFCKRVPTSYSHLVMQYYGWRARPGGGLFVLEAPGRSLACRDLLAGKLQTGNVLEPRLSFDGKRIVFSYVELEGKRFDPNQILNDRDEGFYHIYSVNVDGSDLRQVTSGPFDDVMPTWLPDGGIAFCSTRRQGYARCFGAQFSRRWHVYTLHRVESDGSGLRTLSFHDTNEWFPAVSHTGHILYARWDYIDRDAVTHQNLWATRPDGTDPVAVWGNATASPHCTFQIQPIPGSSKFVFAASAHHSIAGGSIAIVDPTVAANGQEAITRITPGIPFPEAEGNNIPEYYDAPWPLSEKYFLVGYSPTPLLFEPRGNEPAALGLYVLDVFGNRELLYRDPEIGASNPCPLRARPTPPVLASHLPDEAPPQGEMVLADVYQGLGGVPRGTIKQLRVVQIFPKTTHIANSPPIGLAKEENGRAILGTVPVEADGSARFLVPAQKPLYFQALDADGFAYQTMRTVTYVQPGEKVACVGCHENRRTSPPRIPADILALAHAPSKIDPGELGGRPFSFVASVQPILDQHCVRCHGGEKTDAGLDLRGTPEAGFTKSYVAMCNDIDFWAGGTNPENAAKALVPRFGGRNQVQITPPGGGYGALGSRLMKLLRQGHENVRLTDSETRRLAAWIDLNAIFYGVNLADEQTRQLRGEAVAMPDIQ